jgi:hypothetical protein
LKVLTDEDSSSLSVQLSRLVKTGVINRVARDWYENPFNSPSSEECSMVLRNPSYLSMEYALYKEGVLSQQVFTLTIITTKQPYLYKKENIKYEYHQIKKSLFGDLLRETLLLLQNLKRHYLTLIYI